MKNYNVVWASVLGVLLGSVSCSALWVRFDKPQEVVRAQRFELTGANGEILATLGVDSVGSVMLSFKDPKNRQESMVMLGLMPIGKPEPNVERPYGAMLHMEGPVDAGPTNAINVYAHSDGCCMAASRDEDDDNGVSNSVVLGVDKDASSVTVTHEKNEKPEHEIELRVGAANYELKGTSSGKSQKAVFKE